MPAISHIVSALSALFLTALTVLLLPLLEAFSPKVAPAPKFRSVSTVTLLPQAKPITPPQKETPQEAIEKELPTLSIADDVAEAPQKPLTLPIVSSFSLPLPSPDLTLSYTSGSSETLPSGITETSSHQLEQQEITEQKATVLSQSRPEYPYRAKVRGIEGSVQLEFTVLPDGTCADIVVLSANPPGYFEKAAVYSVSTWRFAPATREGAPVSSRMKIQISFDLLNQ